MKSVFHTAHILPQNNTWYVD